MNESAPIKHYVQHAAGEIEKRFHLAREGKTEEPKI